MESIPNNLGQYFQFWEQLLPDEKALMLSSLSVRKYVQGENIHSGELDCIGVFAVRKGVLRTYLLSEEGKEITLYRLYEGDVCVLSASCILKNITFDVYIDAETDCEILLLNTSAFSHLSNKNIHVENYAYKLAMDRFSDVMWAIQQILFMSFDKRLAVFLLDEISKTGDDTLRITHEQIAKYIGSAREVVTRMLKYFADEKMVTLSRGTIQILDKTKLRNLI